MKELGDYAQVNAAWGPGPHPKLEAQEVLRIVKRLYRKWMGHPWRGDWKLTSGRRHTWAHGGTFYVNPRDVGSAVHGLSHYVHRRLNPGTSDHGGVHATIECEMIEHVLKSGWLDGRLKPKPKPAVNLVEAREGKARAHLDRWERKLKQAERKVREYRKRVRYYEKRRA